MAVETEDDRAVFIESNDFGVTVAWTRGVTTTTLDGLFENPSADTGEFEGAGGLVGSTPTLLVRTADVPSGDPAGGDTVVIAGVTWRVNGPIRPDGTGFTVVHLERNS